MNALDKSLQTKQCDEAVVADRTGETGTRVENSDTDVTLAFEDNRLAGLIYGEHDRNLALIEDQLGVDILARGNRLTLRGGTARDRAIVRDVLNELYERAGKGSDIDTAEVNRRNPPVHCPAAGAGEGAAT